MKIWTLANFVTVLRVLLVPVVIYTFFIGKESPSLGIWVVSIVLLFFCEITDALDGYLARSMSQVSELGKLLDPLCDSLWRFSVFMAFSHLNWIPFWTVFIFFYRDLTVAYLRIIAMSKGVVFGARLSGKLKAVFQGVAIFVIVTLVGAESVWPEETVGYLMGFSVNQVNNFFIYLACMVTIWSGCDYAYKIFHMSNVTEKEG